MVHELPDRPPAGPVRTIQLIRGEATDGGRHGGWLGHEALDARGALSPGIVVGADEGADRVAGVYRAVVRRRHTILRVWEGCQCVGEHVYFPGPSVWTGQCGHTAILSLPR